MNPGCLFDEEGVNYDDTDYGDDFIAGSGEGAAEE